MKIVLIQFLKVAIYSVTSFFNDVIINYYYCASSKTPWILFYMFMARLTKHAPLITY